MTVTYDVSNDIPLKCISIAGSLSFRNDISTRLKVETLLVLDTGTLQVGTAAAPIAAGATAEIVIDDRPIDTQFDPEQFGTGIIGFGRIVLHGAPKQPTFLRLNSEVTAGAATLVTATALVRYG